MLEGAEARPQRVAFWMLDGLDSQVNIEVGPMEMVWLGPLDMENGLYRGALEPGKLTEWEKQLSIVEEKPKAIGRAAAAPWGARIPPP